MQSKRTFKPIPTFKNEDREREFWATHDSTEYVDWSKAKLTIFPNLKLTKRSISLRITDSLLAKIKLIANKRYMPYQTLMKQYLMDAVEKEFSR
jgi:predicted DNA binding CopG/RHH family protein